MQRDDVRRRDLSQWWPLLKRGLVYAGLCLGVSACNSSPTDETETPSDGDAGGAGAGGAGVGGEGAGGEGGDGDNGGRLFGTIALHMMEETETRDALTVASGRLYDRRPRPVPRLRTETTSGDCALWVVDVPHCSEGCESGSHCVDDDTCEPHPSAQDGGPLWLDGASQSRVALEAFPPSFIYQSQNLPYPACQPGDVLSLEGETLQAESRCIEPLRMGRDTISVRRDEPVLLSWEGPNAPDGATIHILLDVSHHGGKAGEIVCEVADIGAFAIPAPLVTSLIDLGLSGFPSVVVTRKRSSPTTLDGVSFEVLSTVERPVETGVVSCLSDEDCPAGRTCDTERVLCRP